MNLKQIHTDDLRALSDRVRREIQAREGKQRLMENRAAVGRCFKYRNSYSCPQKPSDYFYLYVRVTRLDAFGYPTGWSFEIDSNGEFKAAPKTRLAVFPGNWLAISDSEFERAKARFMRRLKEIGR